MKVKEQACSLAGKRGEAVSLKSVHVDGRLDGLMLHVKVRQSYRNEADHNIEAVYTFPLAWGATLLGMSVELNGKRMQARVLEKKEATEEYEKAIDGGDTPVMVEKSASGLYTANLGNLKPDEDALIEIEYAQLLRFEQGRIRLLIPTTVGPRYGDAHRKGGLAPHESAAVNPLAEYPFTLKLDLFGRAATAKLSCASHKVGITAIENGMSVRLEQGGMLDRDFVLNLDDLQGQCFAVTAPDDEQHAVLASFCPKLPAQETAPLLLKILVDCSGSMNGDSIVQARTALHEVFQHLSPADRVSYTRFGSTVEHVVANMEPCKPRFVGKVLAKALKVTESDLGGTELNAALRSTFEIEVPGKDRRDAAVLLITDGDVWDIENIVKSATNSGHRVFAVGVGSAPAESLLRDLAEKTGGACELVSPNEDMCLAVMRMFNRMRASRTVDIDVNWGATPIWQSRLSTQLFDGETVHVFAQLADKPEIAPALTWISDGKQVTVQADILGAESEGTVARMGGARRMVETSGKQKSLALALKYQLVSEQTNLILVHVRAEDEKAVGLPTLEQIEQMQAAGWGGLGTVRESRVQYSMAAPSFSQKGAVPDYVSMSTPSVWRTRDRAQAAARVDALASSGADDFEVPVFMRKQEDSSAPRALMGGVSNFIRSALRGAERGKVAKAFKPPVFQTPVMPRDVDLGPIVTPIEILRTFEAIAVNQLAENRLIAVMQNLNIPDELAAVLDDLTAKLGSGAKAWAVVIKWLGAALADQLALSRQGERLLRLILKSVDTAAVDLAVKDVEKKLGPVGVNWGPKCRSHRKAGVAIANDDFEIPDFLRKQAD
ncbi:MAG: VWA domain-containing protein [Comamonadaceae bacterium]|nr:MAG: VWA domain-containing protein [Comamonadaceae bacterium]